MFIPVTVSFKLLSSKESNGSLAQYSATMAKLEGIDRTVKQLSESISKHKSDVDEQMDVFRQSYASVLKQNTENIQKTLEVNSSAKQILTKTIEQNENDLRKKNAILYGLDEDPKKSTSDQIHDILRDVCFQHIKTPINMLRLGNKVEGKKRPVKLEFVDETSKWEFLKRANATMRSSNIFCKLDVSRETRDREYVLRQEVRKLKETHHDAVYRIRNCKIQQRNAEGNGLS